MSDDDWKASYKHGTWVIWPEGELSVVANALRTKYDPESQGYCPAHITLTQPFIEEPASNAWDQIEAVLQSTKPISVVAGPLGTFPGSTVLRFEIQPADSILHLRHQLHRTGLFDLTMPFTEGFIPHLTVSEYGLDAPADVQDVLASLGNDLGPFRFHCDAISYIRPDEDFTFRTVRSLALMG